MQENNQVQTPVASVATPQVVAELPKQSNFLTILLSVLLLLAVSVAGFFAYQTQKLVSELRIKNEELRIATTVTPEPTIEPVATNSAGAATDSTANWKTYTNNEYGFKFNYLEGWEVYAPVVEGGVLRLYAGPELIVNEIKRLFASADGFGGGKFLTFTISEVEVEPVYNSDEYSSTKMSQIKIAGVDASKYETDVIQDMQGFSKGDKIESVVIPFRSNYLVISLLDYKYKDEFDQILSTFKFIN